MLRHLAQYSERPSHEGLVPHEVGYIVSAMKEGCVR
jgi:hypothetical protein